MTRARPMGPQDLVDAVDALLPAAPVVGSVAIRRWCDGKRIAYDGSAGRGGRHFERADHDEYHGARRLQKWKAPPATYAGARVGWSPAPAVDHAAYARAERWVIANGWDKLEHEGGHWVRHRWDPTTRTWKPRR